MCRKFLDNWFLGSVLYFLDVAADQLLSLHTFLYPKVEVGTLTYPVSLVKLPLKSLLKVPLKVLPLRIGPLQVPFKNLKSTFQASLEVPS